MFDRDLHISFMEGIIKPPHRKIREGFNYLEIEAIQLTDALNKVFKLEKIKFLDLILNFAS